jgi:hypothetical protein
MWFIPCLAFARPGGPTSRAPWLLRAEAAHRVKFVMKDGKAFVRDGLLVPE